VFLKHLKSGKLHHRTEKSTTWSYMEKQCNILRWREREREGGERGYNEILNYNKSYLRKSCTI